MIPILVRLYESALSLYPLRTRQVYAREQAAVFFEMIDEASRTGRKTVFKVVLREILDFPGNLLQAYFEDAMFTQKTNTLLRWTARILSILISAFLLMFIIGEGIPNILNGTAAELIPFLPWLGMAVIGTVLIWFMEIPGASLMIIGAVAMAIYLQDGRMFLVYSLPYLLAGIMLFARFGIIHRSKPKSA